MYIRYRWKYLLKYIAELKLTNFVVTVYMQKCTLNSIGKGWLIANGKKEGSSPTGFVFKYCTIRTSSESTFLGRAWNEWSTVVFFKTYMSSNIQPLGWEAWYASPNE